MCCGCRASIWLRRTDRRLSVSYKETVQSAARAGTIQRLSPSTQRQRHKEGDDSLEGLDHACVPENGGGILAPWDVSRDVSWDVSWDVEMKETRRKRAWVKDLGGEVVRYVPWHLREAGR